MSAASKNIDFKAILEYYMNDGVMNLEKEQLDNEIMDLLAIMDFLERKVPLKVKTIKNRIEDYHNDLNKVKKSIHEITMPYEMLPPSNEKEERLPDLRYFCNIDFAYDNYSKLAEFSQQDQENELDIDYENVGLREMELKYLESIGIEKYNKTRGTAFKNIDNRLHLTYKKYLAVMGLKVQDSQYVWSVECIKDSFIRKSLPKHRDYFNNVISEQIKKQNEDPEVHILAAVFKYLSFIDMIDFRDSLFRLPVAVDAKDEEIINYQRKDFQLTFSFASIKRDIPLIKIRCQREKQKPIQLSLSWRQSYIQAELEYFDITLKLREALDNITPSEIIDMIEDLIDLSKTYDSLKEKYAPHIVNLMKDFMYWKLGNYHWYYELWQDNQINSLEGGNGIYLTNTPDIDPVVIKVSESAKFQSRAASSSFIEKLILSLKDLKVLFIYLDLIRFLSSSSSSEGCEIDDFRVDDRHISIEFKQKVVYEDQTIKAVRGEAMDDRSQFTSMSFMIQFDLPFKSINMFITNPNREPYLIEMHCTERWRAYMSNQKKEGDRLSLEEVKKNLDSLTKHFLIKRIYERRLQDNNRALIQLSF